MSGSRLPLWGSLAGAFVGMLVAAALLAGGVLSVPVARDMSDAQNDFLAAWERSRQGTFVVDSDFRRTVDGRTLYSPTQLVQRPPDRIVRQFSGISGTVEGRPIVCSTDQTGHYTCAPSATETTRPDAEVVRREVDDLRSYFTPPQPGATPLYRVLHGQDPGCFELFRQLVYPDAPYGSYARLCFDEKTGALSSLERRLDGGVVERQDATSIRTDVMLSDFDVSSTDGYELRMDVPDAPVVSSGTTPGTVAPAVTDPASMTPADLVEQGSNAAEADRQAFVDEAVARLRTNQMNINAPLWRDAEGRPRVLAGPVVTELLRQGWIPAG